MTRFLPLCCILISITALPVTSCSAQNNPAQQPPTLEEELAAVAPAWTQTGRLLIEVNLFPDLPPAQRAEATVQDAAANADTTTPEGVAASNGYITQWYDGVMAVAPASMKVINTDQSLMNLPMTQLAAIRPLQFLFESLTADQFALLAGPGLSYSDLTADQQPLFADILPSPLQMVPANVAEPFFEGANALAPVSQLTSIKAAYNQQIISVPDAVVLDNVRLHAYLHQDFSIVDPTGSRAFEAASVYVGNYGSGVSKLAVSNVAHGNSPNKAATFFSHLLISRQPNVPKPSDLAAASLDGTALVSVAGVKTVDDLVSVLAKALKLELYADASYGKDPVFFAGDLTTNQSAVDVLSALTLCVHGAWRSVGPAYVLTDDKLGLSARQQFAGDILRCWKNRLNDVNTDTVSHLKALDWIHVLNDVSGDGIDLMKEQFITRDQLLSLAGTSESAQGEVKWKDLSSPAQDTLKKQISDQEVGLDQSNPSIVKSITPDTIVNVSLSIQTALELSDAGIMSYDIFPVDDTASTVDTGAPAAKAVITEPIRGVLCAPKSADEARQSVDLLPSLGLNTLFLDVFNNGRTYFRNSSIAPENQDAADVLKAALTEAAVKQIAVYAVVDTLCWRKDCAAANPAPWPGITSEDINIFNETSEAGVQRRLQTDILPRQNSQAVASVQAGPANEGWVSPIDPVVTMVIPALVKELATVRGLAGIVFEDTAPPGYEGVPAIKIGDVLDVRLGLGYSLDNRLAFLRSRHVDPIDVQGAAGNYLNLPSPVWAPTDFDVSIPGYGESASSGQSSWTASLASADLALLKDCFSSARAANPALPILMKERLAGLSIEPWKDQSSVVQLTGTVGAADEYSYIGSDSLLIVQVSPGFDVSPSSLPAMVDAAREKVGSRKAGGIVFDLVTGTIDNDVPTMLKALTPYLATAK